MKRLLAIMATTWLLFGCNHQEAGLPKDIEAIMEEELQVDIVVPAVENYRVKYAEIQYPPLLHHKPVGNRLVAKIVYTDKIGPLIPLTAEQTEEMEKRKERKIVFGEYEGKPVIILEISNMKNSLADAKTRQIDGVAVEYGLKEVESGTNAFYSFNYQNVSYMTICLLSDSFNEQDAIAFQQNLIAELK